MNCGHGDHKIQYPDMSSIELDTREPDYIEQYYWMEQEIGQVEYQTNYDELNLQRMIDIEWIDNTERNRECVFEAFD